jgi:hypothetical protein
MFPGRLVRRDAPLALNYCIYFDLLVAGAGFTQIPTLQKTV